MKITLESTSKVVQLDGVAARIWEGKTESGIEVHAFITRIAVHKDSDNSQFESELCEQRAPSAAVESYPMRLVL